MVMYATADNERFGASGAVPPQTNRTKNAKSYSADKSWNAPPAQSRRTLWASLGNSNPQVIENCNLKTYITS